MRTTHPAQQKLPVEYNLSKCADCGADRGGVCNIEKKWPFLCHKCHNARERAEGNDKK